jgi:hypothetical protein
MCLFRDETSPALQGWNIQGCKEVELYRIPYSTGTKYTGTYHTSTQESSPRKKSIVTYNYLSINKASVKLLPRGNSGIPESVTCFHFQDKFLRDCLLLPSTKTYCQVNGSNELVYRDCFCRLWRILRIMHVHVVLPWHHYMISFHSYIHYFAARRGAAGTGRLTKFWTLRRFQPGSLRTFHFLIYVQFSPFPNPLFYTSIVNTNCSIYKYNITSCIVYLGIACVEKTEGRKDEQHHPGYVISSHVSIACQATGATLCYWLHMFVG